MRLLLKQRWAWWREQPRPFLFTAVVGWLPPAAFIGGGLVADTWIAAIAPFIMAAVGLFYHHHNIGTWRVMAAKMLELDHLNHVIQVWSSRRLAPFHLVTGLDCSVCGERVGPYQGGDGPAFTAALRCVSGHSVHLDCLTWDAVAVHCPICLSAKSPRTPHGSGPPP